MCAKPLKKSSSAGPGGIKSGPTGLAVAASGKQATRRTTPSQEADFDRQEDSNAARNPCRHGVP